MSYHIGITGTRSEITFKQECYAYNFLRDMARLCPERFLQHGNCVGADTRIAKIAHELKYSVICHPPEKTDLVGDFKDNFEVLSPKSYFARNRDIVDACHVLLVLPFQNERQDHGGTWYTFDYTIKKKQRILLFLPNGNVQEFRDGELVTD